MDSGQATLAPISEVCRALGITARALRYYDGEGLVSAARDGRNRRVFSAEACAELEVVARLRNAGVPVEEVRWVLQAARRSGPSALVSTATDCLTYRLRELAAQQQRVQDALEWMEARGGRAAVAVGPTAENVVPPAGDA